MFVLKDKAIYHALNMFTERGGFFYGSCWCALEQEDEVRDALEVLQSGELHRSAQFPED